MKVCLHVKYWEGREIFLLYAFCTKKPQVYGKPECHGRPTFFHITAEDCFVLREQSPARWEGWGREGGDIHTLFLCTYLERLKKQLHNFGTRSW